jgi:hypothetical protein
MLDFFLKKKSKEALQTEWRSEAELVKHDQTIELARL